jgi:hypothetical protein
MTTSGAGWRARAAVGLRVATAALLAVTAVYLVAFRRGWLPARPVVFAWLVAALVPALLGAASLSLAAARAGRTGRWRAAAAAACLGGLALVGGAGLLNWLSRLQGFVVLQERGAVPLAAGERHLAGFEAGPLADPAAIQGQLQLERLVFEPVGPGLFRAWSRLRVLPPGGEVMLLEVTERQSAAYGDLVLHQGAFGFAPRITISKGEARLFDEHVPFTTRREPGRALTFAGAFDLEAEGLHVEAGVTLESLDDVLRGHPELTVSVSKGDAALGGGRLRVGEAASVDEGYRIGFSGLRRWSEIDVTRRTRTWPLLLGAALAALGALAWPVAAWRRW